MSDLRIACELQGWILIEKDSSEKMHNVTQWKSGKQAKIYDGILTLEEFNLRFIFANSANDDLWIETLGGSSFSLYLES